MLEAVRLAMVYRTLIFLKSEKTAVPAWNPISKLKWAAFDIFVPKNFTKGSK